MERIRQVLEREGLGHRSQGWSQEDAFWRPSKSALPGEVSSTAQADITISMTPGGAVRLLVDVLLLAGGVGLGLAMVLRFAVMGQVGDLAVEAASGRFKPANRKSSVVA